MSHNCPWLFWWSVQRRPQYRSQQTRPALVLQYDREQPSTRAGFGRLRVGKATVEEPVDVTAFRDALTDAKEDAERAWAPVSAFSAVALGLSRVRVAGNRLECVTRKWSWPVLTVLFLVSSSLQDLEVTCSGASLRLKEPLMMMSLKVWAQIAWNRWGWEKDAQCVALFEKTKVPFLHWLTSLVTTLPSENKDNFWYFCIGKARSSFRDVCWWCDDHPHTKM